MHRFILVAPLDISVEELEHDPLAQPTTPTVPDANRMQSQENFDAGELTQTYVRRKGAPSEYPDGYSYQREDVTAHLYDTRLIAVAGAVVLTTDARVDTPVEGASVPTVELVTSEAVAAFVAEYIGSAVSVQWVNRTFIAEGAPVPPNWLAPADETERLVLRARGHSPVLTVGWGNNALEADADLTDLQRTRLVEGLVDAQVLWGQLDLISRTSAEMIRANQRPDRKRELVNEQLGQVSTDLAGHNLYYDELLLNIQGTRRQVATAVLRSWGYPTLLERVGRRVNEIERAAQQEADANRRSYQGIVEAVLLAIGLVSLLQLLLALVQTAFSGGVEQVPGSQRNSIMDLLRRIDLDIAIWLTSIATLLAFVGIILLKRRS